MPGAWLATRRGSGPEVKVHTDAGALLVKPRLEPSQWFKLEKALGHEMVSAHVANLLAKYRSNVVLDVGANKGQFAQRLRAHGYQGHIVSFEPVPRDFEICAEHAAGDPRWTVHQMGLGSSDGQLEMNVYEGTLSSFLPASEFGSTRYKQMQKGVMVTAPVRRLDGVLDEVMPDVRRPRPFLKTDTQGFDLEVFRGLGDRSGEFVGLVAETVFMKIYDGMPRMPEALQSYEAAGFEISGLFLITREARTWRALGFDCVMVRAEALAKNWSP